MDLKRALVINIVFFTIIFTLHALRSILQWSAMVANVAMPVWLSYIAAAILLLLMWMNWRVLKNV